MYVIVSVQSTTVNENQKTENITAIENHQLQVFYNNRERMLKDCLFAQFPL